MPASAEDRAKNPLLHEKRRCDGGRKSRRYQVCPAARQRECEEPGCLYRNVRSAGEISTLKAWHQMMTLGYFLRSTPTGIG
jgi:hypothetical protein